MMKRNRIQPNLTIDLLQSLSLFTLIGYGLSRFFHKLYIIHWQVLLLTTLVGCITYRRKHLYKCINQIKIKRYSFLNPRLIVIWLFVFCPILLILFSPRALVSSHGPFHSAYVYEIMNNSSPPTNVLLPETPSNYYWLYHALLSVISKSLSIAPPVASILVNGISLFIIIKFFHKIVLILRPEQERIMQHLLVIISLFTMNLFGWLVALSGILSNSDQNISLSTLNPLPHSNPAFKLVISTLILKFQNFNGFPIGIAIFSACLYLILAYKTPTIKQIQQLTILTCGALLLHTTTGLFIIVSIWGSFIFNNFTYLSKHLVNKSKLDLFVLLLPVLLSIFFVYEASNALPAKSNIQVYNLASLIGIILTSFPIIILLYFERKWIHWKSDKIIIIAILFGYLSSAIFILPDNNQYKFISLSTILLGILLARVVHNRVIFHIILISIVLNFLFIILATISNPLFKSQTYKFQDGEVIINTQEQLLYDWIKSNTDTTALIILQVGNKDDSHLFIAGQRLSYVTKGDIYATGNHEYKKRIKQVSTIFQSKNKKKILETFKQISSFSHQYQREIFLVSKGDEILINPEYPLEKTYSIDEFNIYRFK